MSFLSDLFTDPGTSLSNAWNSFTQIPGSPEAVTQSVYNGIKGDQSWNPYAEGASVWDQGALGSKLSEDPKQRAAGHAVGTAIGSYFTGGLLGSYLGSAGAGAAANGALWSGAQAAGTGGNVEKSMLRGGVNSYLGSYMPDVAGAAGATNPTVKGVVNGVVRGGGLAAMNNQSVGEGAIMGGLQGGIAGYASDRPGYQATDNGQQTYNDITQTSSVPDASRTSTSSILGSEGNGEGGMSFAPAYTSTGNYQAPEMQPQSSSWSNPDIGAFMNRILPQTPEGYGDLASGLLGMYAANKQRRMARDLRRSVGGNRDAYLTQMTRELQRRDAAAGRRSNYGGRAVELQSNLAKLDQANAPAMAQLQQAELGGLLNMFQTGLRYGDKTGIFKSQPVTQQPQPTYLPSMIGQSQAPSDFSLDQNRRIKFGGPGG